MDHEAHPHSVVLASCVDDGAATAPKSHHGHHLGTGHFGANVVLDFLAHPERFVKTCTSPCKSDESQPDAYSRARKLDQKGKAPVDAEGQVGGEEAV